MSSSSPVNCILGGELSEPSCLSNLSTKSQMTEDRAFTHSSLLDTSAESVIDGYQVVWQLPGELQKETWKQAWLEFPLTERVLEARLTIPKVPNSHPPPLLPLS